MRSTQPEPSFVSHIVELDLVGLFHRRWHHLLLGCLFGLALAVLYQYATTPMFESHIEILVGQRSSELTNSGTVSTAQATGDVIHEDLLATHMQLIASRRLLANAIEDGKLLELKSLSEAVSESVNPIDFILENLDVERGGKGMAKNAMVLSVTFRDSDAQGAAQILTAIYKAYQKYVEVHSQSSSEDAAKLIEAARVENEAELVAADSEYRAFIQTVPVLLEGEQVKDIHKTRLDKLEIELNGVRTSLAEAKSRLDVISQYMSANGEDVVADLDNLALLSQKEVERLKLFLDVRRGGSQSESFQADLPIRAEAARTQYNRLLELLQKERTLHGVYGPSHPLIETVSQEIEVIQQFIAENAPADAPEKSTKLDGKSMLSTFVRLLQNDVADYEIREKVLLRQSNEELHLAKEIENAFLEGNAKKAKLTRAQTRYDEVIRRLQELKIAGSYAGFSTDLLASPEIEDQPAWPKLPIVLVMGALLGFFIGGATGMTAELFDTTFRDVEDLERTMGAPAIAHVPRFKLAKLKIPSRSETSLSPSLLAAHCPRSAEAEVYRVARTSLMIKFGDTNGKVLLMSSPHPGDGKSTTLANLAISFAHTGKKILLIDSDLRRPVVAGLFGIGNTPGLADVLLGNASLAQCVQPSSIKNLTLLVNGIDTSEPAELLQSNRMNLLLQQARQTYDLILIDAPPLLAVADPAIVAPLVDGVLITVRICKNGRRPVERARRILSDLGIEPMAIIVNGVDGNAHSTYGYGHYRSGEYDYVGKYHDQYAAREKVDTVRVAS